MKFALCVKNFEYRHENVTEQKREEGEEYTNLLPDDYIFSILSFGCYSVQRYLNYRWLHRIALTPLQLNESKKKSFKAFFFLVTNKS